MYAHFLAPFFSYKYFFPPSESRVSLIVRIVQLAGYIRRKIIFVTHVYLRLYAKNERILDDRSVK